MTKETGLKYSITKRDFGLLLDTARYSSDTSLSNKLFYLEYNGETHEVETHVSTQRSGNRIITPHQVEALEDLYAEMLKHLDTMVEHGFKIVKLILIMTNDNSGARFSFEDPRGRLHHHEYINDVFLNIIPKDFLNDLSKFPTRLG